MTIHNIAPALRMESFSRLHKTHQGLAFQIINNQKEADGKRGFRLATALAIIPLVLAVGCTCGRDIRSAQRVATVEVAAQDSPKGYVEFYSTAHKSPIPILLVGDPERPLGAIGLANGDKYSYSRHGMIVGEKLRGGPAARRSHVQDRARR